ILDVPLVHHISFRKWATKAGTTLALLWDLCKHKWVKVKRRVTPVLSDQQKVNKVDFVVSHIRRKGGSGVLVDNLYDSVHVDVKWFYILKDGQCMYLHPTEDPSNPPWAQNMHYIMKAMFLAAVGRPRKLSNGVWFKRKIRIWPI
ncbi:unnamed protein product, partial [Choristocarpus tenellus]